MCVFIFIVSFPFPVKTSATKLASRIHPITVCVPCQPCQGLAGGIQTHVLPVTSLLHPTLKIAQIKRSPRHGVPMRLEILCLASRRETTSSLQRRIAGLGGGSIKLRGTHIGGITTWLLRYLLPSSSSSSSYPIRSTHRKLNSSVRRRDSIHGRDVVSKRARHLHDEVVFYLARREGFPAVSSPQKTSNPLPSPQTAYQRHATVTAWRLQTNTATLMIP